MRFYRCFELIFIRYSAIFVSDRNLKSIQNGCWKKQQDAAPHQLQDESHPPGRQNLHWTVQGVRQAHERDPGRLRGVQEAEAQVCQGCGEGGEESVGSSAAERRKYW